MKIKSHKKPAGNKADTPWRPPEILPVAAQAFIEMEKEKGKHVDQYFLRDTDSRTEKGPPDYRIATKRERPQKGKI